MARSGTFLFSRTLVLGIGPVIFACLTVLAPDTTQPVVRTEYRPARPVSDGGTGMAGTVDIRARMGLAPAERPGVPGGLLGLIAPMKRVDCRVRRCVALTFDDGPAEVTARLLDILGEHGARATFFLVGRNVREFPRLVRREAAEGHELANHTDTHANLRQLSHRQILAELRRAQSAIRRTTGVTPRLMRPPYGATDGRVAAVSARMKLAQVLWSLDPLDWRHRNAKKVERSVVTGVRKNSIVLLHDIHPSTVEAMPGILRRLAARGYFFVTVSELYGRPLIPGKMYPGP
jgi:peptidoglycan/xylan/chitin deacetylase (PgdA/CDA1 family)